MYIRETVEKSIGERTLKITVLRSKHFFLMEAFYMLFYLLCFVSKSSSNFFVTRKYSDSYKCITNSSFALSWINEDKNLTTDSVSEFIPKKSSNSFDCDIKHGDYKTEKYFLKNSWTLKNSLQEKINDVILDYRWEDMPTLFTDYSKKIKEQLKFQTISSSLKNNFKIPFSLINAEEVHIFLCDGENPGNSNCYWLILQGWQENITAIRKCNKGQIPVKHGLFPVKPCHTPLTNISHPQFRKYLTKEKWTHFVLLKENNYLSFSQIGENYNDKIIDYYDNSSLINVSHMIVNSKSSKSYWKIHQLEFIYTNKETHNISLGATIQNVENFICVSMFVSMCSSCKLKLALITDSDVKIKEKTYKIQHSNWTEIKFVAKGIKDNLNVTLFVSTIGNSIHRYWALDKFRLCQKQEFRMLSTNILSGRYPQCQLISSENNVISFSKDAGDSDENHCPENTIGKFCVPCEWVFSTCEGIKTCDLVKGKETCFCQAGFKGDNCYFECESGTYGHGCKKKCGHCKYLLFGCNNINGTCDKYYGCDENYHGEKCDMYISPNLYFTKPPKVANVGVTTATVIVQNFDINERNSTDGPVTYGVQYKKNDNSTLWNNSTSSYKFYEKKNIELTGLEADTEYLARCVITTHQAKTHISDLIPYAEFRTKFQRIPEVPYDVEVNWTRNNDMILKWKYPNATRDNVTFFLIEVFKEYSENQLIKEKLILEKNVQNHTYFYKIDQSNLSPSTIYTILIHADNGLEGKKIIIKNSSPPSMPLLKEEPYVSSTKETISVKVIIKELPSRENCSFFLLVQSDNYDNNEFIRVNNFHANFSKARIVYQTSHLQSYTNPTFIIIGGGGPNNSVLSPGTMYNVTFLLINEFKNKTKHNRYSFKYSTTYESKNLIFLSLLALLLLIPIVAVIYVKKCRNKFLYGNTDDQNEVTSSIPLKNFSTSQNCMENKNMKANKRQQNISEKKLKTLSKVVPVAKFKDYIEKCQRSGELKLQYDMVLQNSSIGSVYDTVEKNQYFDYIDIKFMDGEEIARAYIATEIPKPSAVADFWKIIWEERIEHTVLLHVYENDINNEKGINYWPENNQTVEYNDIRVQHIFTKVSDYYEHRTFILNYDDEIRNVEQLLLRKRRNSGVQCYSEILLPFFQKILKFPINSKSPILVHSSGGVEATGFVILCDMCLRISKKNAKVDVLKNFQKLVHSNKKIVKNYDYYKLAHLVILDYYFGNEKMDDLTDIYANV